MESDILSKAIVRKVVNRWREYSLLICVIL
jgi:hypothetical protein